MSTGNGIGRSSEISSLGLNSRSNILLLAAFGSVTFCFDFRLDSLEIAISEFFDFTA